MTQEEKIVILDVDIRELQEAGIMDENQTPTVYGLFVTHLLKLKEDIGALIDSCVPPDLPNIYRFLRMLTEAEILLYRTIDEQKIPIGTVSRPTGKLWKI